jgi:hypothetical protein
VPKFIGNILLSLADQNNTFIKIKKGPVNRIDNRMLPSKNITYFFLLSLSLLIFATTIWLLIYHIQKYRLNHLKQTLQV